MPYNDEGGREPKKMDSRRRSSFGGALKPDLDVNDDEAEREERRIQKEEERAKEAVFGSPYRSPTSRKSMAPKVKVVDEEMVSKLSQIISLAQENKITTANSFKTNLLENLDTAVGMDFKETNFQQASCALDAGAKIYASRVDNVHSNTLKVLGGLGRTDQGNDQDVEDMDADDHDGDEPSKPRTRKVREGANVFENNLDNINMKSDSTAFSVDPMFHIMSAKFDEGGARGLLMHNLHVSWEGGICFDSAASAGSDGQPFEMRPHCDQSLIDTLIAANEDASPMSNICPDFAIYRQTIAGDEQDVGSSQDLGPSLDDVADLGMSDDEDDNFADSWEEVGTDDTASMSENIARTPMSGGLPDPAASTVMASQVMMLEAIQDGFADYTSEYGFFGRMQAGWAGAVARRLHSFKKPSEPKAKKEKKVFMLDFDNISDMEFGESFAIPSKTGLDQLTDAAITKQYENRKELSLPSTDHKFELKDFTCLTLRPSIRLKASGNTQLTYEECQDGESYDYSNAADANNYTANDLESAAMDCDDDGYDGGFGGYDQDGLIDEPEKVAQIRVNFDRVARQLDVKKLKECMWSQLSSTDQQAEDNSPTKFSEVLADVPNVIPEEMRSNVSVPYCFICLLHLANEKNLTITDQRDKEVNDLSELDIKLSNLVVA